MRTEAINSFSNGLIQDMYGPQVPSNVMTNALNATLITYNGNEFALQNDMGNAKIGTAFLPKGYVPVGMKEHGGIVYVASMNPETGKGQIGSFPSPQRLYGDDEDSFDKLEIKLTDILSVSTVGDKNYLHLKNDFIRTELFKVTGDVNQQSKIFHPGDKFIIIVEINDKIQHLIDKKILTFKLAVVSEQGQLQYINDNELRLFNNGEGHEKTWFKYIIKNESVDGNVEDEPVDDKVNYDKLVDNNINTSQYVQVYGGKLSGKLVVITEYQLFDNFNVFREYSVDNSGNINVKLTGEATGYPKGITAGDEEIIEGKDIYYEVSYKDANNQENTLSGVENSKNIDETLTKTATYSISPSCYYGINDRLKKEGSIDFDKLRKNKDQLSQWSQYVTDQYLTINWSYDYFDISSKTYIDRIVFEFYDLYDAASGISDSAKSYEYEIIKDIYSGNFEEIIPFNEDFIYGGIYVCIIRKYTTKEGDVKQYDDIIGVKYIYNTPLYNTWTSEQFTQERPEITLDLNVVSSGPEIDYTTTILQSKVAVGEEVKLLEKSGLTASDLTVVQNNLDKVYRFDTCLQGNYTINYDFDIQASDTFMYNNAYYSKGIYLAGDINSKFKENIKLTNVKVSSDNYKSEQYGATTGGLQSGKFACTFHNDDVDYSDGKFKMEITGTVKRSIHSESSGIKNKNINVERLLPVYDEMDENYNKTVLLGFNEDDGVLTCIGGDEDGYYLNTAVYGSENSSGSDLGSKISGGTQSSFSSACINQGNKTINILTGANSDHASLACGASIAPNTNMMWYIGGGTKGKEFDEYANFMIVSWKCTDGQHRLIPLATRKNEMGESSRKRVDAHIKCILSQLLIAKRIATNIKYKAADSSLTSYHLPHDSQIDTSFNIDMSSAAIYLTYKSSNIDALINGVQESLTDAGIETPYNFLPQLTINPQTSHTESIQIGGELNINPYIAIYNQVDTIQDFSEYTKPLTEDQRKSIHLGIVKSIDGITGVCKLQGDVLSGYDTYKNWDGFKLYSWNRDLNPQNTVENEPSRGMQGRSLKRFLIPKIEQDGMASSEIPEGYNNELLVICENDRLQGIRTNKTVWVRRGDGYGPEIMWYINFDDVYWGRYNGPN